MMRARYNRLELGLGLRARSYEIRDIGYGFRVMGYGFKVIGYGFRVVGIYNEPNENRATTLYLCSEPYRNH